MAWGKVRITDEAFVLAISFHAKIGRADDPHPAILWHPTDDRVQTVPPPPRGSRSSAYDL